MRLTPRATVRFRSFFAFSRSGGHPQMPSPVTRMAPNPSRLTVKSPPIFQVDPAAAVCLEAAAANVSIDLPVKIAAPVPSAIPRNTRRVTVSSLPNFAEQDRGAMPSSVQARQETVNRPEPGGDYKDHPTLHRRRSDSQNRVGKMRTTSIGGVVDSPILLIAASCPR